MEGDCFLTSGLGSHAARHPALITTASPVTRSVPLAVSLFIAYTVLMPSTTCAGGEQEETEGRYRRGEAVVSVWPIRARVGSVLVPSCEKSKGGCSVQHRYRTGVCGSFADSVQPPTSLKANVQPGLGWAGALASPNIVYAPSRCGAGATTIEK